MKGNGLDAFVYFSPTELNSHLHWVMNQTVTSVYTLEMVVVIQLEH